MSEPGAGYQGEPGYGVPFPPAPPQTYGQPRHYGQPQHYGQSQHHGRPQTYGRPVSASPDHYGPPVSAAPQQVTGSALQPYSPAAAPVPYAQPYPVNQVAGYPLVSAGGRIGAALLDFILVCVTLWIGWFVWAMITWSDGQTPAKKLLGHVVADANTGRPFDWGRMALREVGIKSLLGWLFNVISFSVYFWVDSFMLFGDRQRTLHDRMANSIVRHV